MEQRNNVQKYDSTLLLAKFNDRDNRAFGEVYDLFYRDFHFYCRSLYEDTTIDSNDIIQDVFADLWQRRSIVFDNLIKVKAFVIIAIKNGYKNYLRHNKYQKRYAEVLVLEDSFKYEIIENELYSIVNEAVSMLPTECGKVFSLYLEGWKPDEIALKLGKKPQTVYNKKQEAITLLRRKLSKEKLFILSLFIS